MSAQYDLLPGLDPSSLPSITQAQLLQMISQIVPLSNIGGVIVMSGANSSHPDITNNNRFTRYIWLDTQTAGNPVLKIYTGTPFSDTYADWSSFAVPNNSVTTAMLQALSVTLAKLSSTGGTNGQLLIVNAAGGFSFTNFSTLLSGGIVPLTALDKSAAADGQVLQFKTADGLVAYRSIDPTAFAGGSIGLAKLANLGAYSFLTGDTNGVPQSLHFDTSAKVGNYFDALTIPLTRLEGTGTPATGDYLIWNGSNWVKQTNPAYDHLDTSAAYAVDTTYTFAHGIAAKPSNVLVTMQCISTEATYAVGQELALTNIFTNANASLAIHVYFDATNVKIFVPSGLSTIGLRAINCTTFGTFTLTLTGTTKWNFRIRAWK